MPFRTVDDSNFTGGVNKELPSWALPQGYLADASNMIFDLPGAARQRNGSTALSSPTTTAFSTAIGWAYSNDGGSTIEELYGVNGKTGDVDRINKTTGARTNVASSGRTNEIVGRPCRHFGFGVFPIIEASSVWRSNFFVAGSVSSATFTSTATASVTLGAPSVTLSGADTTTNINAGQIVAVFNASRTHYARVVNVQTSKIFNVWPPISFTDAAIPIGAVVTQPAYTTQLGGACAASFQGRLLSGNANDNTGAGGTLVADRRVNYSLLLPETNTSGATTFSGATWVSATAAPTLNYFDVPGSDPIVAMESISDNELLILTTQGVIIFRGTLASQTSTSAPGITFDISPLNTNTGCLSDLSVQRTPHGIIWASAEGVMLYTGGGRTPIDLTAGKYHTAWRNLTRGSSFVIHGAYYARNHYVVSGSSGGSTFALCFNMDNQTWSPLTGVGTDIFNGVVRPSDPSQVYAGRWWDQTGAAPSQTGGHIIRVDSIFAPDVAGQTKTDSDGSAVAFSLTTRTVTDDMQSERILRRVAARYAATHTAFANITVAAGSRIDTTDSAGTPTVSIGNLSNTSVLTITGQSNATPIVITTSGNHGLQSGDEVDIRGVTTNSNANGHWRIVVLSATTFSLAGSVGNGATTSTGTCKKITEQELDCSATDIGQGNYLVVASAGTVNKFEWHGMRLGVMEMMRGMAPSGR